MSRVPDLVTLTTVSAGTSISSGTTITSGTALESTTSLKAGTTSRLVDAVTVGADQAADGTAIVDLVSTTKGLLIPRMTETQRDNISSPATGLMVYNTTDSTFDFYNGSGWTQLEENTTSVTTGVSYVTNPIFESNSTGWNTYDDGASSSPVDGTGGSPGITFTRTTTGSEIVRGTGSGKLSKDASDRQGEGVSVDFTIDRADLSRNVQIDFDWEATANFAVGSSSDISVRIYDVTNTALIGLGGSTDGTGKSYIGSSGGNLNGHFRRQFFADSTSTSYRLIFHIATTNALAWDFFVDKVHITPIGQAASHAWSRAHGGSGHGSTNTNIRRFTSASSQQLNSEISFSQSSTDGDSWTIREAGVYAMSYGDRSNSGANIDIGISLNASGSELTSAIESTGVASNKRIASAYQASSEGAFVSAVRRLYPGDVIRAHTDANPNQTNTNNVYFFIERIAD